MNEDPFEVEKQSTQPHIPEKTSAQSPNTGGTITTFQPSNQLNETMYYKKKDNADSDVKQRFLEILNDRFTIRELLYAFSQPISGIVHEDQERLMPYLFVLKTAIDDYDPIGQCFQGWHETDKIMQARGLLNVLERMGFNKADLRLVTQQIYQKASQTMRLVIKAIASMDVGYFLTGLHYMASCQKDIFAHNFIADLTRVILQHGAYSVAGTAWPTPLPTPPGYLRGVTIPALLFAPLHPTQLKS